ncbi:hypothetical protein MCERE19_01219 [Spirosomataceae bacterium]|jgi:hypothetical protein
MKKMLVKFGNQVLSREELKNVIGGASCCSNASKSLCNGTCGPSGGTCEWQEAKPSLGLGAGCICNHGNGGIQ